MARHLYLFSSIMFLLAAILWSVQGQWTFTAVSCAVATAMLALARTPGIGRPPADIPDIPDATAA